MTEDPKTQMFGLIDVSYGHDQEELAEFEIAVTVLEAEHPGTLLAVAKDESYIADVRGVAARMCIEGASVDDVGVLVRTLCGSSCHGVRLGVGMGVQELASGNCAYERAQAAATKLREALEHTHALLWMWMARDGNRIDNDDLTMSTYTALPGLGPPPEIAEAIERDRHLYEDES